MLKSRKDLEKYLESQCEKIVFKTEICQKIREYMLDKYNVPTSTTMDMIARNILGSQTLFVLFCLADGIDYVDETDCTKEFFTEIEISSFSSTKLETDSITFPLKIKCDQVTPDQWVGVTDSNFLMQLRKAQLIKYNVNAQRVMSRIIKGENILFKLIPNKIAIGKIKQLMQNKAYVPTTITLNIPYDSDADFYFNDKTRELVINSIKMFDISDGYHRLVAMCELSDSDKEFNYPMEIRIINFTDEKARQFIYQEDQKTHMAKGDSDAMNTNRPSNNVVDRLNQMSTFEFKGQIGLNHGNINYADFSGIIEYFYFSNKKEYKNSEIAKVRDEVKEKLNALAEYYPEYLEKIFNVKELALVFYVFNEENDLSKACETIHKNLKSGCLNSLRAHKIGKPLFKAIEELIK